MGVRVQVKTYESVQLGVSLNYSRSVSSCSKCAIYVDRYFTAVEEVHDGFKEDWEVRSSLWRW
jgi:hypothetical protein